MAWASGHRGRHERACRRRRCGGPPRAGLFAARRARRLCRQKRGRGGAAHAPHGAAAAGDEPQLRASAHAHRRARRESCASDFRRCGCRRARRQAPRVPSARPEACASACRSSAPRRPRRWGAAASYRVEPFRRNALAASTAGGAPARADAGSRRRHRRRLRRPRRSRRARARRAAGAVEEPSDVMCGVRRRSDARLHERQLDATGAAHRGAATRSRASRTAVLPEPTAHPRRKFAAGRERARGRGGVKVYAARRRRR